MNRDDIAVVMINQYVRLPKHTPPQSPCCLRHALTMRHGSASSHMQIADMIRHLVDAYSKVRP